MEACSGQPSKSILVFLVGSANALQATVSQTFLSKEVEYSRTVVSAMVASSWPTSLSAVSPSQATEQPSSVRPDAASASESWIYEVRPSRELPTLDLSITLKSHVLQPGILRLFDRFMSIRSVHLVAYVCTTLLYILICVTATPVGQTLGVLGFITGLPGTLYVVGGLRSDTIKVLLRTYDIIFFGTTVFVTLVTLMAMLHDTRALVVLQSLLAYQINIFADANIEAVRRIASVNAFAMICTAFVASCITVDAIRGLHHFTIFQIGPRRFEARDVVTNGFVTVLAIMIRNTYRKRALLSRTSKGSVVDCVSYRCSLMLERIRFDGPRPPNEVPRQLTPSPPHIQTMRYVSCMPLIHAERVLVPRLFMWLTTPSQVTQPRGSRIKRVVFCWLGFSAAALAIVKGSHDFVTFKVAADPVENQHSEGYDVALSSRPMIAACVLTLLYTSSCFMVCQRDVLAAICSSFDFVFLSSQLTFVHIAIADFFRWQSSCVLLLITWLWSHWVFTIDALTPVVRERMGFSHLLLKIVVTALVLSTAALNNLVLFSENTVHVHDRVIWSGVLLGEHVEFRMLPMFYSTFVNVMAWALRVLWRVFAARPHEWVMVDGPVAYDNYLRPPPKPPSRSLTLPRLSIWKPNQR